MTTQFQVNLELKRVKILNRYAEELVCFQEELTETLKRDDLTPADRVFAESTLAITKASVDEVHYQVDVLLKKTGQALVKSQMRLVIS